MPDKKTNSEGFVSNQNMAVLELGLPATPKLVGAIYTFGDTQHSISGTVNSVDYTKEEGVTLHVSTPRYRGQSARRLRPVLRNGKVYAETDGGYSGRLHIWKD